MAASSSETFTKNGDGRLKLFLAAVNARAAAMLVINTKYRTGENLTSQMTAIPKPMPRAGLIKIHMTSMKSMAGMKAIKQAALISLYLVRLCFAALKLRFRLSFAKII